MANALTCQRWAISRSACTIGPAARHYSYCYRDHLQGGSGGGGGGGTAAGRKAGPAAGQPTITTTIRHNRALTSSFRTQAPRRTIHKASASTPPRSVTSSNILSPSSSTSSTTTSSALSQHRQSQSQSQPAPTTTLSSSCSTVRSFSTSTSTANAMAQKTTSHTYPTLIDLLANRRSYYALNSTSPIPDSKVQEILAATLNTVPSSFNMQSTRYVLAVGPHHEKIWDHTTALLRAKMGEERWKDAPTAGKIASFRAAHGTVLFYDDVADVDAMKGKFAAYADKFAPWADQANGMHQLAVWTALEAEGLGANLQHYNPVIDEALAKEFGVPATWELKAQLVFGGIEGGRPADKDKKPTDQVLKVFV